MRWRDRHVADRPAEDLGAPGRRENQLHQQLQRGGLAGAVRTEEAEDLARLDLERQAIERAVRPLAPEADRVVLGELLDANRWRHAFSEIVASGPVRRRRRRLDLAAGLLQLQLDRRVEQGRRHLPPAITRPLMKKVGVDLTPSSAPSPASVLTSVSARAYCASKSVMPADVARGLPSPGPASERRPGWRRASPRAYRPCPSRCAMTTAAAASHDAEVQVARRRRRCTPRSSGKCLSTNFTCPVAVVLRDDAACRPRRSAGTAGTGSR